MKTTTETLDILTYVGFVLIILCALTYLCVHFVRRRLGKDAVSLEELMSE